MAKNVIAAFKTIEIVTYEDSRQVGFLLTDKEGSTVFIPMNGADLAQLVKKIDERLQQRPDVLLWQAAPTTKQ